jgi:hypothetical protein
MTIGGSLPTLRLELILEGGLPVSPLDSERL